MNKRPSDKNRFISKWSKTISEVGFTMLPNLLFIEQKKLGITDNELVVIINLEYHRFTENSDVWPSAETIAKRSGKHVGTVRRHLYSLRDKGYIRITPQSGLSNLYDITPLIKALELIARYTPLSKYAQGTIGITVQKPYANSNTEEEQEEELINTDINVDEQKAIIRKNLSKSSNVDGWEYGKPSTEK